ncbi:hypothetical protein [Microvirga massiliensis]|uniref:hypothetical protein n=1 Tax=Microvirga massiliensis TaxID=1033741 RepID=UPI0006606D4D|nr:hypothetical protein [Microvirga massiliensis]
MNSPDISLPTQTATTPPDWIMEKIESAKARGWGFCLIYVEPEQHEMLCEELNGCDLGQHHVQVFPARGPDLVREAAGDPDHMPIMLKWADPIVTESRAPTERKKKKAAGKKTSRKKKQTA